MVSATMTFPPSQVKFALVSHVLPPSSSGQAVVLYRLLRDYDPQQYCLISVKDYGPAHALAKTPDCVTKRLAATYYVLPAESRWRLLESRLFRWGRKTAARVLHFVLRGAREKHRNSDNSSPGDPLQVMPAGKSSLAAALKWKHRLLSLLQYLDDWLNMQRQIKQRARGILQIVQREKCAAIVACSGDVIDIPAAFLASQWAHVAFYPYLFDDYVRQWVPAFQRQIARAVCQNMMKKCAEVIVPNEFLAKTYRDDYEVDPVIVPNPIEDMPPLARQSQRPDGKTLTIVYTGAIYEAHFDAFTNLICALGTLPPRLFELQVYTNADLQMLARHGIEEPARISPQVTSSEAQQLQKSADVLFLPLAFTSPFPEIIRTSAPGKMGELLASGRPVLVHAPRDSFISWYSRKHECAIVVDEPDPELLHQALLHIIEDPDWAAHLVQNAWQRARDDFGLTKAREIFFQTIAGYEKKR